MEDNTRRERGWEEEDYPWDEFKWEQVMREQDERVERYLETFTKCKDLPNCEELIARELNWDYDEEDDEPQCPDEETDCEECPNRAECDIYLEGEIMNEDDEEDTNFREDPFWKESYDFATRIQGLSIYRLDAKDDKGHLFELMLHSRMIPAKIAGAFGIGFHIDGLGGNIANHKRAIGHTLYCIEALTNVEADGILPQKICARFRKTLFLIREHLMKRIDELRALFQKLMNQEQE